MHKYTTMHQNVQDSVQSIGYTANHYATNTAAIRKLDCIHVYAIMCRNRHNDNLHVSCNL